MSDWKWCWDDDDSDISHGVLACKRMLSLVENTGTMQFTIPWSSTKYLHFVCPANQPGNNRWPAGEVWTAKVDITLANPNITLELSLNRLAGNGTYKQGYSISGGISGCGTTGIKNFGSLTLAQDSPEAGDRLQVVFKFVRNNNKGSDEVAFKFGEFAGSYVEVPIEMANSQILWDSNALNFPNPLTDYEAKLIDDKRVVFSQGGVPRVDYRNCYNRIRAQLARFDDAQFKSDLHAWWSWAKRLNSYSFALDSSETIDTTLDGAAASGQKVIPLTSTAGISVGKKYLVRESAGYDAEEVQVASISAGVSVTVEENLKFSYASGDIFRSLDYFPKVVAIDNEKPLVENPGLTFTLDHLMREDLS